ncbi:MAG: Na+/H+ antiporter subunit E [Firmicutes bacterium]|nr:Na+/H+ antiporter subunit E [Bacillota bacterium]
MRQIEPINDSVGFWLVSMILLSFWFLMSPTFDVFNVTVGVACAVGITYYWRTDLFRLGYPVRFTLRQLILLIVYLFHLVYNVVTANIALAKIVLRRRMPISPGFILVRTKLTQGLTRVLYANSITLTPGTITINMDQDRLLVHAITEDAARDVAQWYMQEKLAEIEVSGSDR